MKTAKWFACGFVLVCACAVAGVAASANPPSRGKTEAGRWVRAKGGGLTVGVREEPWRSSFRDPSYKWWGGYENEPNMVVTKLFIRRGTRGILVPRSIFADLANVNGISIRQTGKSSYEVMLEGGDAGVAYSCRLKVRGDYVVERKVASGEFPEYDNETTTYVVKTPPDN